MTLSFPVLITLLLLTDIISVPYLCSNIPAVNTQFDIPSFEDCAPVKCGNSTIQYPFGKCGPLSAECQNNQTVRLFERNAYRYNSGYGWTIVGDITESRYYGKVQIAPYDYATDSLSNYDWLLQRGLFILDPAYIQGTLYACKQEVNDTGILQKVNISWLNCSEALTNHSYCYFYPATDFYLQCTSYTPIWVSADVTTYNFSAHDNFEEILQSGFQITWSTPKNCLQCQNTEGRCLSFFHIYDFYGKNADYEDYCICPNGTIQGLYCYDGPAIDSNWLFAEANYMSQSSAPPQVSAKPNGTREGRIPDQYTNAPGDAPQEGRILPKKTSSKRMAEIIFPLCAVFSIAVLVSGIMIHRQICSKKSRIAQEQSVRAFMDPLHSTSPPIENFLNYYSSQMPTRYSYAKIKAYTKNLAEKVGQGSFGTVYKGKLPSGRPIAVKILDESKQSEQQFIAEVATVGRTYHVNLVRLLGYCVQRSKRALVYEYMTNGSLDKYIHGSLRDKLDWKQLYSIAIGTARGIAYLHEDCNNHILHCDIKPHNVLLDADFSPKVADFGLAKISDRGKSHISVANRGTLGYAAPEMWSGMYGSVTDKSDVYSYGMLVMEMVGARKNIDKNLDSASSKFYYPEWAFKQVENGEFGNLREGINMSEEDQEIAKKLCLVGLWCIQFKASGRPSMNKVIQMLEGVIDISIPPVPFPVDTPVQQSVSHGSSSSDASEVQMINPTSTQSAKTLKLS